MQNLKFKGDITLDQIFDNHRELIYNDILSSIKESYLDNTKPLAEVIKITINDNEYTINLTRDKFEHSLRRVIEYYEGTEDYEKCAECITIINHLNKNTMEI
jgi:hypothetical protein